MKFRAELQRDGKSATGITIPTEVLDALDGGRRPAVTVTLNGHAYRTTVGVMGGVAIGLRVAVWAVSSCGPIALSRALVSRSGRGASGVRAAEQRGLPSPAGICSKQAARRAKAPLRAN